MNPTTVAHLLLANLRRTHPAYEIVRGNDESGRECWQARLAVKILPPMREAGLVEVVQQPDGPGLAMELRRQAGILQAFRATSDLQPRAPVR
ncbi:hypothetical protein ACQP2T_61265 [Nonomuraea sp. CA-143628]|uniref:hypothetical protein n=1 Tax=Nonomuraea sp. CA-143628 TaxID=3239997 RepID=UPI003D9372BC